MSHFTDNLKENETEIGDERKKMTLQLLLLHTLKLKFSNQILSHNIKHSYSGLTTIEQTA